MIESADSYSARAFGGATFAAFDGRDPGHVRAAAGLRERLIAAGFGPDDAAALFGLRELSYFNSSRSAIYAAFALGDDAASDAARLFVLHDPLPEARWRRLLGDATTDFLRAMGAVLAVEGGWRSVISATWFAGNLIVADARAANLVWPREPFDDHVMAPGPDSIGLLHVAPRVPRRNTVDLCCGSGAQTLAAAAYSERVTGVDINPRALRFAQVNLAVNGIQNVRFTHGDCFEPLGTERFDAILANPPFVPWPAADAGLLYRGGGTLGDDVIARILAGAVQHLERDGSLAIVADYANTASLPRRIARWQGGRARRTLIVLQHAYELAGYAETHAGHLPSGPQREAEIVRLLRHYAASGITAIDFGYIVQDGTLGTMFQSNTAAPRDHAVDADVTAFFEHQRRFDAGPDPAAALTLAPGLRIVREVSTDASGNDVTAWYARPGVHSVLEEAMISEAAYAVLHRASKTTVRLADFIVGKEATEARSLLQRGFLRFA